MNRAKYLGLIAICLLSGLGHVRGQGGELVKAYDEVVAALESGQYEKGLGIVSPIIEENKETAPRRYGPAFGHFYYVQGMLFIRQKKFEEAIEPLRICYEDFSNVGLKQGMVPNLFQIHALMQWGGCLQALERYEEAVTKYEKVLEEDPKREPRINTLAVQMNLGRCYIRSGQRERGEEMLESVLNLKGLTPDELQDAFTLLAADGVVGGESGPGIMDLVNQHSGTLFGSVNDRAVMNPRLASLGTQALAKGDALKALMWFNLMTSPFETIRDQRERQAGLEDRRKLEVSKKNNAVVEKIDSLLAEIKTTIAEKHRLHADSLLGMGAAQMQLGNLAAARAIYEELDTYFPEHEEHAVVLHNLVVCEAKLERWDAAFVLGDRFFQAYPKHELRANLARLLAEVVYLRGDFQLAHEMAVEARPDLNPGDPGREGLDFVAGASLYQLGQMAKCEAELEQFMTDYPESPRQETVTFYLATAKVTLGKWEAASPILDAFVSRYPQSPMRPTALYLGASAELIMEDYLQALARVNSLIKLYPEAREIPRAHNLRGDVLAALEEDPQEVVASYEAAKAAGVALGEKGDPIAAYALKQLIRTSVSNRQWEDALNYYQSFQAGYRKSPEHIEAAVIALDAYIALDRKDEGRAVLEGLVQEVAANPEADLDLVFGSYTDFLLEEYSVEETLQSLDAFSESVGTDQPAIQAAILMGKIEALEGDAERAEEVDQAYKNLAQLHQSGASGISGLVLVRLARWMEDQGDSVQAQRIYDSVLESGSGDALGYALIDSSKFDYTQASPLELERAKENLERVLGQVDDTRLVEEAILGLGRITLQEKRWKESETYWIRYLEQPSWNLARPEANFSYGVCLDQQGKLQEALKVYVSVYANFSGHLDWSIEANMRAAEIMRGNGRDLDALKVLQDMLRRTKELEHPKIEVAKQRFFKWRDEYTASQK